MAKELKKTRKDVQDLGFEETDNPTGILAINSLEVLTNVGVTLGYNVKLIVIKTKTIQIWLVLTHWKNMSKIFLIIRFATKIWRYFYIFSPIFFRFITNHLNKIDPQHRRWYLSARQEGQKTWRNHDRDQSIMANLEKYFLESKEWGEGYGQNYKKEHLVYDYSIEEQRWELQFDEKFAIHK